MRLPLPSAVYAGLVFVALTGLATDAHAIPATYDISGVASGRIGDTIFTDASVEVTGIGDTDNVVPLDLGVGFVVYGNVLSTTTVTIVGVGTATINDPFAIWAIPMPTQDPRLPPVPLVIIGRIDNPPALDSLTGMAFSGSNVLTVYDLTTAIGPVVDFGGITFNQHCGPDPSQDPCIATDLGVLSFSRDVSPTDQSTFVATLQPAEDSDRP